MQLDRPSLRRVVDVTRQFERIPRATPPRPSGPQIYWPIKYARVTAAIKAATATGPGRGMAAPITVAYASDGTATWGKPGKPQACYSFDDQSGSDVGALVIVAFIDGQLNLLCELCPAPASSSGSYGLAPAASSGFAGEGTGGDGMTGAGF